MVGPLKITPRSRRLLARRDLIGGLGQAGLSAASLGFLTQCASIGPAPLKASDPADDPAILTDILALEYQAIAAYGLALEGGALAAAEQALATGFAADHGKHAEALARTIARRGGTPVQQLPAARYGFAPEAVARREDALRFLADIEQGLALAHLGSVPALSDKDLAKGAAGLLAIEAMHWALWREALGQPPVPAPFLG